MPTAFYLVMFVVIVCQLASLAMLQQIYRGKAWKLLQEKQTDKLLTAVRQGTEAADAAYHEANTVNEKISHLNERLLAREPRDPAHEDPGPWRKP